MTIKFIRDHRLIVLITFICEFVVFLIPPWKMSIDIKGLDDQRVSFNKPLHYSFVFLPPQVPKTDVTQLGAATEFVSIYIDVVRLIISIILISLGGCTAILLKSHFNQRVVFTVD